MNKYEDVSLAVHQSDHACSCLRCVADGVATPLVPDLFEDRSLFLKTAYQEYRGSLQRYFVRNLRDKEDASDLMQETYLRLADYDGFQAIRSLRSFLFTTAGNILKDYYRRQKVRPLIACDTIDESKLAGNMASPERILDGQQRVDMLKNALEGLDERFRTALILHRFHKKTYSEIAVHMDVSERTVHTYIRTALDLLHARMRHFQ
ncbi:RNA polymerase sigma factor [Govanella unica]|uniref:RNA polymerase sigma factor n=1 Tax=Govanella unica TaxID=2975056 RepID=A0A9X3TW44_9PROT|nr:RNA polymerase sigma factor [Govania unica]MDA5192838.1 RNA polymerase sigma factor [Govania unica]